VHELSIATEIHRACRRRIATAGPARLERVTIRVGELSAVEPELLRFAWEAITAGGPDAGSRLEIEWRPATQVCEDCGRTAERAPGAWIAACPSCGRPLRIEGGLELDLLEFAYAADGAPEATPS
jgi:hydrogenase nickel incorporation protein HypA/HybF